MDENIEKNIPKEWQDEIRNLPPDEKAADLSLHRTRMSTHRTELSTHRTELSTERTNLSLARSHMSNERTHLSYLRTSLALLSFGITLNRFSIYFQENKIKPRYHAILYETQYVGLGMVLLGLLILGWSLGHYRKTDHDIETFQYRSPKKSISIFTMVILLIGGFSAVWMIVNQSS